MSRHLWKNAHTLTDPGELTARWLEGDIDTHPGCVIDWPSEPDKETRHLIPTLAACNRAGFVTVDSQPGMRGTGWPGDDWGGGHWEQRACVVGFVDDKRLLKDLKRAAGRAGLTIVAHGPGAWDFGADRNLVITTVDGQPYSWAGSKLDHADAKHQWGGVSSSALRRVSRAWQVTIIDPEWGRDTVLWPALDRACR